MIGADTLFIGPRGRVRRNSSDGPIVALVQRDRGRFLCTRRVPLRSGRAGRATYRGRSIEDAVRRAFSREEAIAWDLRRLNRRRAGVSLDEAPAE